MLTRFCRGTNAVSVDRHRQLSTRCHFPSLPFWRTSCMVPSGIVRVSYVHVDDRPLARPPTRSGGWVVDPAGFRRLVDMEVQKAQRLRYSLAVLCFAAGRNGFDVEPSAA